MELEMEKKSKAARTKLPKLVIPKFKAMPTDWIDSRACLHPKSKANRFRTSINSRI